LLVSWFGLNSTVQRGFGDLECPAYLRNRVVLLVEILGNTELLAGKGFGSVASFPSGSGCHKTCCCSLPDKVSFKLCQCAEDMEDQFSATGCRINVLHQAFKTNTPLLKAGHRGNQMRQRSSQPV
jgi:hypothetical protein